MSEEILKFIGSVIAYGGGGAAVAYGLFLFFGKKWIEDKFSKSLETYKNEQQKELEDFKYRINTLFSRVLKIHDKEMEILPEAWSKLHSSIEHVSSLVSVYQEYPDFNNYKKPDIISHLESIGWKQHQIDELLDAPDMNKHFQENIFWYRYNDAHNMFSDFYKYIKRNKIFMGKELKDHFSKVADLLWEALIKRKVGEQAKDHGMMVESYKQLKENLDQIVDDIEKLMQDRLRYHEAT